MAYTPLPSAEEAAGLGFSLEDYVETAEVWPENWAAFAVFMQLDTQWRIGMSGPTGLDYQVLFGLLDRQGLDNDDWQQMFDDIRAMERAALKAMQSK